MSWFTSLSLAAGALAVGIAGAAAQDARAPNGPIEIVVGSAAGSSPDVLMRRAAQIWNESGIIANPIVVQNRTGGAWTVGMKYVTDRPGDENVLLALAEPVFATPIVQGVATTFDQVTPLAIFAQAQIVILAQPDHKANNLAELVALAKDAPRMIKVAGSTVGGPGDQVTGLIQTAAGVQFTFIPHAGAGAAEATFLGGNTDIMPVTIEEALPLLEAKKAKALAILTDERRTEDGLKDIPTAKEQGIDAVFVQIFGIAGAPKLDPAVKAWWGEKIEALIANETWQKALAGGMMGNAVVIGEPLPAYLQRHHESRSAILKAIGLAKN